MQGTLSDEEKKLGNIHTSELRPKISEYLRRRGHVSTLMETVFHLMTLPKDLAAGSPVKQVSMLSTFFFVTGTSKLIFVHDRPFDDICTFGKSQPRVRPLFQAHY
jgi:hypothetical protein